MLMSDWSITLSVIHVSPLLMMFQSVRVRSIAAMSMSRRRSCFYSYLLTYYLKPSKQSNISQTRSKACIVSVYKAQLVTAAKPVKKMEIAGKKNYFYPPKSEENPSVASTNGQKNYSSLQTVSIS